MLKDFKGYTPEKFESPLYDVYKKGKYGNYQGDNFAGPAEDSSSREDCVHLCEVLYKSTVQVASYSDSEAELAKIIHATAGCQLPEVGRVSASSNIRIQWVGPHRFNLLSDEPDMFENLKNVIPTNIGAVVDLSHARVVLNISGSNAINVLTKFASIDFKGDSFTTGSVVLTSVAHIPVVLDCLERSESKISVNLYAYRTFAGSVLDFVEEACAEFGCVLD